MRSMLYRISVATRRTLKLADLAAVEALGVSREAYASLDYERTQEIADAADFLGFDGLIAPGARWPCQNLVLFLDKVGPDDLRVLDSEPVDWAAWRDQRAGG
jgi:RES domain